MVGMGFTMGKGVYGDTFSEYVATADREELMSMRDRIADPALGFAEWLLVEALQDQPSLDYWLQNHYNNISNITWGNAARIHFREDWMASHVRLVAEPGLEKRVTPVEYSKLDAASQAKYGELLTTGGWIGWRGDAEEIIRQGLLRTFDAYIAALDTFLASNQDFSRRPQVDFRWVCGGNRLEWWNVWDDGSPYKEGGPLQYPAARLVVTVLTPGQSEDELLNDWYADPPPNQPPPPPPIKVRHIQYADPVRAATAGAPAAPLPPMGNERGMIVTGRRTNATRFYLASGNFLPKGAIPIPSQLLDRDAVTGDVSGLIVIGEQGDDAGIATVAPAEEELGIRW